MKTKVWLTRSWCDYELWTSKPFDFRKFWPGRKENEGAFHEGKFLIRYLCSKMAKKCFRLKKHLKPNSDQILEGTMEFKFEEK